MHGKIKRLCMEDDIDGFKDIESTYECYLHSTTEASCRCLIFSRPAIIRKAGYRELALGLLVLRG